MTVTTFKVSPAAGFRQEVSAHALRKWSNSWQITARLSKTVQFCAGLFAECLGGDSEHARNAKRLGEVAGHTEVDRLDGARFC
jgi:hypothetical protein